MGYSRWYLQYRQHLNQRINSPGPNALLQRQKASGISLEFPLILVDARYAKCRCTQLSSASAFPAMINVFSQRILNSTVAVYD